MSCHHYRYLYLYPFAVGCRLSTRAAMEFCPQPAALSATLDDVRFWFHEIRNGKGFYQARFEVTSFELQDFEAG